MADSSNDEIINNLSSDQYGMLEAFSSFTEDYFSTTPDGSKLGLFGYLNECAAHLSKAGMFHRNMLVGEYCLNSASLPSSIYGAAIDEGVETSTAVPASATVMLDIPESELSEAITASGAGFIKLDRSTFTVTMDDVKFLLPYSVIIKKDNLSLTAFYLVTDFTDESGNTYDAEYDISEEFADAKSAPFCPVKTYVESDVAYVSIRLKLFQYAAAEASETIYSSKLEGRVIFPINFSGQLMGFKVLYKELPTSEYEALPAFQNKSLVVDTAKYCFYKIVDTQNYQIFFSSNSSDFRLTLNAELLITTFTTLGTGGNFTFSSQPSFSDENLSFSMTGWIYTQPSGGKDRPSLLELKRAVFSERNKVSHKSSETDLNEYFSKISASLFGDGSKVSFIKSRDDILYREYTAFTMIMDSNGNPFPTNTGNVRILGTSSFIDSTMPIVYDSVTDTYQVYTEIAGIPNTVEEYLTDTDKFVYFSPYSISIEVGLTGSVVTPRAVYYNENIDSTFIMNYETLISGTTDVPVVNYISAKRNACLTSVIQIQMSVTTDMPESYKFLLFFYSASSGEALYWTELKYDSTNAVFLTELSAVGLDTAGVLRFSEGKMIMEVNNTTYPVYIAGTQTQVTSYGVDDKAEFSVFTLEVVNVASGVTENFSDFSETSVFASDSASLYNGWRVKAKLVSDDFKFFTNMGSIVRSDVVASETYNTIKSVPLAGANILFDSTRFSFFMSQLEKYNDELLSAIDTLTNNTSLNTKFYNTYGASDDWSVSRTNLSISLEIEREDGYDATVDASIRSICKEFVLSINTSVENNQAISNRVSLSNLSTRIEKEIPSISSCNVVYVNEIFARRIQKLASTNDAVSDLLETKTPEYLTLDMRRNPYNLTDVEMLNVKTTYLA